MQESEPQANQDGGGDGNLRQVFHRAIPPQANRLDVNDPIHDDGCDRADDDASSVVVQPMDEPPSLVQRHPTGLAFGQVLPELTLGVVVQEPIDVGGEQVFALRTGHGSISAFCPCVRNASRSRA